MSYDKTVGLDGIILTNLFSLPTLSHDLSVCIFSLFTASLVTMPKTREMNRASSPRRVSSELVEGTVTGLLHHRYLEKIQNKLAAHLQANMFLPATTGTQSCPFLSPFLNPFSVHSWGFGGKMREKWGWKMRQKWEL